jgi:hypothetical protein
LGAPNVAPRGVLESALKRHLLRAESGIYKIKRIEKRSEEQGPRNKKRAEEKRKKEKNKKRSIRTIDEKHCL